jgi:CheY-like chemotaxis protein
MSKHALVVHPDTATRILLERWVRSEGYATRSAPSGDEAVHMATHGKVDLIVLDRLAPNSACADIILKLVSDPFASRIPIAFVNADTDALPIIATSRRLN